MSERKLSPATDLAAATPALNFNQPLKSGDPRWVDLSPARGDNVLKRLHRLFDRKEAGQHLHVVFASHRGAGKTSELHQLAHDLGDKYCTLYFEANVELDAYEFTMEDLLLVLCREVERYMREDVGLPLPDALLQKVTDWFGETVSTTTVGKTLGAQVETGVEIAGNAGFLKLFGKATAHAKVASEHRDELRMVLRKYPGALNAMVNALLTAARDRLEAAHGKELLLIIDNLDRYVPELIDQLLVVQGDRLAELRVNLILTPPISLHYRPLSGGLGDRFSVQVMPSVKLREKDDPYHTVRDPARALLLDALGRRIDLDRLIPEAAARDALLIASGGSIRELLEATQYATLEAAGDHIATADAQKARTHRAGTLREMVYSNRGWADVLGRIAETKQPDGEEAAMDVLFHRLAFKYNGEVWYDVHPALVALREVQAGLDRRAAQRRAAEPGTTLARDGG